jgi:hypothetical protein
MPNSPVHPVRHSRTIRVLAAFWLLPALVALSEPGLGFRAGSWVLSPYLTLNFTRDSNIYKTGQDETADLFLEPELGLRYSSTSEERLLLLSGNGFYSRRDYSREKNLNFDTFGNSVSLKAGDKNESSLEALHTFRRLTDNDRHASDIETSALSSDMVQDIHTLSAKRDVQQAGLLYDQRLSDKTHMALAYRYISMTYGNSANLDLDGNVGQADGSLRLTDKTSATLTGLIGSQHQEGTSGSALLGSLRAGAKTTGSDKMVYNASIGVERYALPGESGNPSDSMSFNFIAYWYATAKVTVRSGGENGSQLSSFYEGNGLSYKSFWTGIGYQWTPETTVSLRAIFRQDDYLNLVDVDGSQLDRRDQRVEGHARVDYVTPAKMATVFLEMAYSYVDSNINSVDYRDTSLSAGLSVHY